MSRTLRFSFSLSDRSPRVARYLAPAWWYGACAEYDAAGYLPVSDGLDQRLEARRQWLKHAQVERGFEDGSIPRHYRGEGTGPYNGRSEPGWEGDSAHSAFMLAYRFTDGDGHARALRAAYHFHDIIVDHAAKLVRMHGYPPVAWAVPMNRVTGSIAAYMETGDLNLLRTAEAIVDNSYHMQLNSWPRIAVGRDARFARSAMMLHRYTGSGHYLRIAHEVAHHVAESQKPDGSFGDQAGGAGIHQYSAYVTKPWMASLATMGVIDYLDMYADDRLQRCIIRTADWLKTVAWTRPDGGFGWSYQVDYDGQSEYFCPINQKQVELPSEGLWLQDGIGRLMTYATDVTGDTSYLDTYLRAMESFGPLDPTSTGDHAFNGTTYGIPWIQCRRLRAQVSPDGHIHTDPAPWSDRIPGDPPEVMGPAPAPVG